MSAEQGTSPLVRDILAEQIAEFELEMEQRAESGLKKLKDSLDTPEDKRFVCSGGKNPANMPTSQYIRAFAEGPCAPAVILPGITGTKLRAVIDCELLKASNSTLFHECGWDTCSSGLFKKRPDHEYQTFIPGLFSPMSFIGGEKKRLCFIGVFSLHYDIINGQFLPQEQKGIKIRPEGETPETVTKSQCGFDGIENLIPLQWQIKKNARQYLFMKEALIRAGYLPGVTMQALGYDWRESYKQNYIDKKIQISVEGLYAVTGKRAVIMAHSMGNYQVVHTMLTLPQDWKDKYIARYMALAPPFIGAPATVKMPLGLDSGMYLKFLFIKIGIDPKEFKGIDDSPSLWELMPMNTFGVHKDSQWMKDMMQRVKEETQGLPLTKGTIMDIFPDYKESCNPGFKTRKANCTTGIEEMWNIGSVAGEVITPDNAGSMYEKFSFLEGRANEIYKLTRDQRMAELQNTGIQVNIVYSNILPSEKAIHYNKSPKPAVDANKFYNPDKIDYTSGDSAVTTTSAIVPGVKWADDYARGLPNTWPVTLAEVCSDYQRRASVFDDNANKKVTKNAYYGIDCRCRGTQQDPSDGNDCNHSMLLQDSGVINFIQNTLIDGQKGKVSDKIAKLSDGQLDTIIQKCELLWNPMAWR